VPYNGVYHCQKHTGLVVVSIETAGNTFGAIFFVSVGMLIDPTTPYEYAFPVLILTLITIFGQSIRNTGALISGQPLKQSHTNGNEFSKLENSLLLPLWE
jgi:CPA2 family monovalent cation:H+ antiporter-2